LVAAPISGKKRATPDVHFVSTVKADSEKGQVLDLATPINKMAQSIFRRRAKKRS